MSDWNLFLNDPHTPVQVSTYYLRPATFNALPQSKREYLWRRARAVAIWNQRAALLKAFGGLVGNARDSAERQIADINDWFANQDYRNDIDIATGAAVTPLLDADRVKELAKQNNRAAQDIASTTVPADLVRIGTDLANAAAQNIGGPVGSA